MTVRNDVEPASGVVIGVLTWNGYSLARACIESLAVLREWPVPVVVIDNGSEEAEGVRLAAEFGSPVDSVRLDPNQGVPGGYNAAISWAVEQRAGHVLLLNNDTIVTDPGLLTRLMAATAPDVAAVGPIILDADGTPYSAGGGLSMMRGKSRHLRMSDAPRSDGTYEAAWLDGPCVLLSTRAACQIGGLAVEFVTYWEELDWCVRARRAGYRCVVEPRTSIRHLRGGTIPSWQSKEMMLRNSILFMRRNGSPAEIVTSLAYLLFRTAPLFLVRAVRQPGGLPRAAKALGRAIGWNLRDAVERRGWRVSAVGASVCDPRPQVS